MAEKQRLELLKTVEHFWLLLSVLVAPRRRNAASRTPCGLAVLAGGEDDAIIEQFEAGADTLRDVLKKTGKARG